MKNNSSVNGLSPQEIVFLQVSYLDCYSEMKYMYPYSHESAPMSAAPYMLTKQGGGCSFECFSIHP